ncbi:DoxX family protein [Luteolibacter ambystomatis]|uniref:DoxX family protein n=1 Tax=Luteolibacter ambystomatis TaxID=2824561 RepID=A0A975J1Z6_9BACT|nr:DoxX family protein [Luteolibacter ambystomatis]QUE52504.1 DoxX family protein [Luteolibacter ambystomatis]
MPPNRPLPILALILRVLLGAWFVYSGGEKVFGTGLAEFTRAVGNYRMVPVPWEAVIAYTLPWFEIVAGLCLVLGFLRKGALLLVAGMTTVFAIAVGHAWREGLNIACGCRGSDAPMSYGGKFAEFAAYFAVIAFVWWQECRTGRGKSPANV